MVARDILEAFKAARVGTACSLWPFVGEACMSAQDSGTCLHVSATRAAAVTTMCCRVVVGCFCHAIRCYSRARASNLPC